MYVYSWVFMCIYVCISKESILIKRSLCIFFRWIYTTHAHLVRVCNHTVASSAMEEPSFSGVEFRFLGKPSPISVNISVLHAVSLVTYPAIHLLEPCHACVICIITTYTDKAHCVNESMLRIIHMYIFTNYFYAYRCIPEC